MFLASIILLLALEVTGRRFYPNGTDRNLNVTPSDRYSPCDTGNSGASMCCSSSYGGDRCYQVANLAQSLCWNQGANVLWRESCTDNNWSNNNCVKLFMNVSDDVPVTDCSKNGWGEGFCYGSQNEGCCKSGQAVFIDPNTGNQVTINPNKSNSTTSSNTTSSTSPATTHTSSEGLSKGASVGIGVGLAIAVIIAVSAAVFFWVRSRRMARNREHKDDDPAEYFLKDHKSEPRQTFEQVQVSPSKKLPHISELPVREQHSPWSQTPLYVPHGPAELGS